MSDTTDFLIPSTLCFPLNLTEVLSSSDNVEKKQRLITTKIYDQTSTNKTMDIELAICRGIKKKINPYSSNKYDYYVNAKNITFYRIHNADMTDPNKLFLRLYGGSGAPMFSGEIANGRSDRRLYWSIDTSSLSFNEPYSYMFEIAKGYTAGFSIEEVLYTYDNMSKAIYQVEVYVTLEYPRSYACYKFKLYVNNLYVGTFENTDTIAYGRVDDSNSHYGLELKLYTSKETLNKLGFDFDTKKAPSDLKVEVKSTIDDDDYLDHLIINDSIYSVKLNSIALKYNNKEETIENTESDKDRLVIDEKITTDVEMTIKTSINSPFYKNGGYLVAERSTHCKNLNRVTAYISPYRIEPIDSRYGYLKYRITLDQLLELKKTFFRSGFNILSISDKNYSEFEDEIGTSLY